ncbi:hypothetical protein Xmau_01469 [Xenorhabdus mauleonii]|uniref:Uncharacterized protein n=1 Tax=Xenorhabdus mauleonii TaxID=351675 RepID=A0A1I3PMI2_9GAMM|nr:hypothetical protein [Xenorhabdus mauleonii]PHM44755.1 hypothetical protein Xmau_01469 [Xenorhabdus mauleonii]SFJ22550.1 hypothetical protein SAMN05421680_106192 [Xenorhabdus mauleonii]
MRNDFPVILDKFIKSYYELVDCITSVKDSDSFKSDENFKNNLEKLVTLRVYQLKAFSILLNNYPEDAVSLFKRRYLSVDLENSPRDQVADLDVMFSDIKEILGNSKFNEILNCPEFTQTNKDYYRVKEAIEFALDEDL